MTNLSKRVNIPTTDPATMGAAPPAEAVSALPITPADQFAEQTKCGCKRNAEGVAKDKNNENRAGRAELVQPPPAGLPAVVEQQPPAGPIVMAHHAHVSPDNLIQARAILAGFDQRLVKQNMLEMFHLDGVDLDFRRRNLGRNNLLEKLKSWMAARALCEVCNGEANESAHIQICERCLRGWHFKCDESMRVMGPDEDWYCRNCGQ